MQLLQTEQEIFDFVATRVMEQGRASMRERPSADPEAAIVCAYRGLDGAKCAVGHIIPDEMYTSIMEGYGSYRLLDNMVDGDLQLSPAHVKFAMHYKKFDHLLAKLQAAHDACQGVFDFRSAYHHKMWQVAKMFQLSATALDAAFARFAD